jgi:hypothetical protein
MSNNSLGYGDAIRQYLPQCLDYMIRQGTINRMVADTINGSVHMWEPQFVSTLPQYEIDSNQFVSLLQTFILRNAAQLTGGGGYGGGYTAYPPAGGYPPGYPGAAGYPQAYPSAPPVAGYGAAPGYGGGGAYGRNPPPPTGYGNNVYNPNVPIYGASPAPAAAAPAYKEEVPVKKAEPTTGLLPEFVPDWFSAPEQVQTTTAIGTDTDTLTEFIYPGNGHEDRMILNVVTNENSFGSVDDIVAMLKRYNGADSCRNVVAKVTHVRPYLVRTKDNLTVLGEHITKIREICVKATANSQDRYASLCEYLEHSPQNVFQLFERIILHKVNLMLAGKRLQTRSNLQYPITMNSIHGLLSLAPTSNVASVTPIVGVNGYSRGYENVMAELLRVLSKVQLSSNDETVLAMARIVGGEDGYQRERYAATGDMLAAGAGQAIVTIPETVMVVGDMIKAYPKVAALAEEPYVLLDHRTGNFEHLLKNLVTESSPIPVYSFNGGQPLLLLSRTLDTQDQIYVKL